MAEEKSHTVDSDVYEQKRSSHRPAIKKMHVAGKGINWMETPAAWVRIHGFDARKGLKAEREEG